MKKINYILALLAIFSIVVFGCTSQTQTGKSTGDVKKADGTIVKADGTMVKPDGTMVKRDGTMIKPDGTMVKPDGTIVKTDGTMVKPDGTMMEKEAGEMAEIGFEMKNGKMIMIDEKTKTETMMEKDAVLNDDTKIMTDGKVIRKDGTTFTLKEGESIWMDGSFMKAGEMMGKESMMDKDKEMASSGYTGNVLAGTENTKYLEFNKADYEKALKEKKKILLYFYANWCPLCKAEQPKTFAAFSELNDPDLIGFRINYKDSDTDADEEALAKQFGVAYQHTKVILKDGKRIGKFPDSWDKQRYLDELAKV